MLASLCGSPFPCTQSLMCIDTAAELAISSLQRFRSRIEKVTW
jgi:hypothetical protein